MIRLHLKKSLPSENILPKAILLSILILGFLLSIFWNPEKADLVTCYFHKITGFSCPTCGLTRSFHAVSHLHFQEAFQLHLMGPVIYFALVFLFLKFSFEIVTRKQIQIKVNPVLTKTTLLVFLSLWLGFWLIRLLNEL
ncbi:MAG: DUF2752 domain-containing protein [Bacteroidales bacterium]|nr:DUF2752 domain-containing protein [Bacteroidales bacterium]